MADEAGRVTALLDELLKDLGHVDRITVLRQLADQVETRLLTERMRTV